MQILLDNPERAASITGYDVSIYLNKCDIKYGKSWIYLHRVLVARFRNPSALTLSCIYRIAARDLKKTPITVENGIRNLMKSEGLNLLYTPKQFIERVVMDIMYGNEPEERIIARKRFGGKFN